MNDYISREAAIEELRKAADCANCNAGAGGLCGFCDIDNAARLINGLPAADVEPMRHGWWDVNRRCSECGYPAPLAYSEPDRWKSPYCPNCGAKMDLEGVSGKEGKGK